LQLLSGCALSDLQIVLRFQVDPEFRRRAEQASEAQRHIWIGLRYAFADTYRGR
jgi:hypothetical protein